MKFWFTLRTDFTHNIFKCWFTCILTQIKNIMQLLRFRRRKSTVANNCHIKYKLFTSNTNCSHQIQIAHIKYKLLTSKTRLNGQRSENENYVQFSLGLNPTAIFFLHMVLSRDVLQQLRKKCGQLQLL